MHANVKLSAAQQQLLGRNQNLGQQSLGEANAQLKGQYGSPADVTGTTNSLDSGMLGAYTSSMDPFFEQQNEQQDAKLAAMGLNPDSQAAELARMNTQRTQDAAITGAAAQFLPEAQQMAISAYNLPMQTAGNLANLGRGAMAQPGAFNASTAGAQLSPTNYGQIVGQNYEQQAQQAQIENANSNAIAGDVIGIGGDLMGMPGMGGGGLGSTGNPASPQQMAGGGSMGFGSNMLSGQPQMMGGNVMSNDQWFGSMA